MLLCDNYNGGYHLFCFKPKLTQVFTDIWYYSSCSLAAPWFIFRPCHTFPGSGLGGDTWEFHLNLLLCIIYVCVCISFWLISFCLWLVLVLLFSRVCYGFTPLQHHTSQHYTSWQGQNRANLKPNVVQNHDIWENWREVSHYHSLVFTI